MLKGAFREPPRLPKITAFVGPFNVLDIAKAVHKRIEIERRKGRGVWLYIVRANGGVMLVNEDNPYGREWVTTRPHDLVAFYTSSRSAARDGLEQFFMAPTLEGIAEDIADHIGI